MKSKDKKENSITLRAAVHLAMAYDRKTFKNKMAEHIGGALLEFYKARLAEKNGQTKWVKHWNSEVKHLLSYALMGTLLHTVRGVKNKRLAYDQVEVEVRRADQTYRRAATNQVTRDFKISSIKTQLDDQDAEDFWVLVHTVVQNTLT